MNTTVSKVMLALAAVSLMAVGVYSFAQRSGNDPAGDGKEFPVIKGYGPVWQVPNAAFMPEESKTYKVTVNVTKAASKPDEPAPGLTHAARTFNVYELAGVDTSKHLKMVVILHGDATYAAMNDEVYKSKYGTDNPNIEVIRRLKDAGADVLVCGQAMHDLSLQRENVLPDMRVAISALVVLVSSQDEGYALLPY